MARPLTEQALLKIALSVRGVGERAVEVRRVRDGNTRYAVNGVTTTADTTSTSMSVTSLQEGRAATVRGSVNSRTEVEDLVRQAEALAAIAPVDPESMPLLSRQSYLRVRGRDARTAGMDARDRLELVRPAIERGRERGLAASGFCTHQDVTTTLGNSAGLRASHRASRLYGSMTFRTEDGTGSSYGALVSHRKDTLDFAAAATRVSARAVRSRAPARVEARPRTVVLEPLAVADLLSFFIGSMDLRRAEEGRSYFSAEDGATKLGATLFATGITVRSLPGDVQNPGAPFNGEGAAQRDVVWIEDGRLLALPASRYWAAKRGIAALPRPGTVHMSGGRGSVDDLIAKVDDGVLVTRFWYNRTLDRSKLQVTGLTRDGTFEIRGGALGRSINNFRYNDSPITMLTRVVAMGTPTRVATRGGMVMVVPPMVVEGFQFASRSDAV